MISVGLPGVTGRGNRSIRKSTPAGLGAKGVSGVLGVNMYLPLHLGQRDGPSGEVDDAGCMPLAFPALRGWYRYPGYCR